MYLHCIDVFLTQWKRVQRQSSAQTPPHVFQQNHLLLLMLLVFEATVYRHQAHHYRQLQEAPPTVPMLFATATRATLDEGLVPCFKYLLNYTFYKFGLEVPEPNSSVFLLIM